jgi:hypothetical protein
MKSLGIGCLGALLGLVLAVPLAVGAGLVVSPRGTNHPALQSSESGQPDIAVVASAAFLNTQFQGVLKQSKLANQGTLTFAAPNSARIAMPVNVNLLGQSLTVDATVSLHAVAQNGRIVVVVDAVDVAGLNFAGSLVQQPVEQARAVLEDEINRLMQQTLRGTGLVLVNLTAAPDNVTLQFKYGK